MNFEIKEIRTSNDKTSNVEFSCFYTRFYLLKQEITRADCTEIYPISAFSFLLQHKKIGSKNATSCK
jgi:hypothetical protein